MSLTDLVDVEQVHAHIPTPGEGADHGAERLGGTTAAADDLTEVLRVNTHFEDPAASDPLGVHLDIVGVVDDAADQVLERFFEHF